MYLVIDKDSNKTRRFYKNGNAVNYFSGLKNGVLLIVENGESKELMKIENGLLVI